VRRALAGAIFKWESQNNMSKVGLARVMIAIIAGAGLSACVTLPPNSPRSPHDPWESWNRGVYKVNDKLDRAVLKPVAVGYVHHVPSPIRTGVRNFFSNIGTVRTMINDALQGKFKAAGNDLGRFALNTTVGVGGLFDPASSAGLDRNNEDFGLTLGHWGVHAGPFLELPLLGPSDLRDGPSKIADYFSNPLHYVDNDWVDYGLDVPWAIDARADLLSLDATIQQAFDPYAFIRDAYLARRAYLVSDGKVQEQEEPLVDPGADENAAPGPKTPQQPGQAPSAPKPPPPP
jgi:phospholipid-binding lipoprotein MlaA